MDVNLAKKISIECVKEAGQFLMANINKVKEVSFKAKSDIVTNIDIGSEKIIIDKIKINFPEHSILSEESGFTGQHTGYIWIMDPIDGTMNYYHASAPFRVALCLVYQQQPIISAIYNPVKDELYFAEAGKGAMLNNRKIHVDENNELKKSVVLTHISSKKDARARTILALDSIFKKTLHMRMFGSGLAAMSYIASGKFDIFFNVKTYPWDILPGSLLIQEAGGTVTDIEGKQITIESTSVLATNGKVHDQMLELLEDI
ncbi:MAG: inositol monophosphatase family protein [Patescibacteria group bacterium]|nr:inositol monophosphatase family protein [Patescibacteria group bacterium]